MNTKKKTAQCVSRFKTFLRDNHDITVEPEHIDGTRLDTLIGEWLLQLRKKNGSEYEPDTLLSFHRGLDRHLRDKGYEHSILFDKMFDTSRSVLQARRKQLKSQGLGNKPNWAEALSDENIEMLWSQGIMGTHNASALLHMLWFLNTELLGLRGSHESRQMLWGDLEEKEITNKHGVKETVLE